jgi:hypothetical protein
MLRFLFVATFLCSALVAHSQNKFTINGYIKDSGNGEELIGVNVYIPQLKAGTTTNAYGFYSLTVPQGQYEIQVSYIGYQLQTFTVDLNQDISRNIEMLSEATMMDEVVIEERAIDANVIDVQMSKNTVNMTQLRKLPALFGEVDIIKNIQMLPGVISAGEGTSAFFVRGGGADQNLILIDEAPVYDPSHLFGLFSVFNADVIKDSELYKGGIPSRFGGRLSSILEVRTKDGNNKCYDLSGGISTLASRLAIEGPIRKDRSSFIVSARRSYVDPMLKAIGEDFNVYFYDVNAKINWRYNNRNRFFLAFYTGRDAFKLGGSFGFGWGNMTGTFRWNHLFNERLFSNTSVIVSNFDYKLELEDAVQGFKWTSNLQELSVKNDLTYFANTNNEVTFGYHLTGRRFSPAKITPNTSGSIFDAVESQHMYALDHGIYVSNNQKITDNLTIDYGVRLSIFQNVGKSDLYLYKDPQDNINTERVDTVHYDSWETIKSYVNVEPRTTGWYRIHTLFQQERFRFLSIRGIQVTTTSSRRSLISMLQVISGTSTIISTNFQQRSIIKMWST